MMWSRASAEVLTISRYWRCSGGCGASSSSSVIPSTPFIGVRISWLMLATNSLLARLAFSAAVLASRSAAVWVRTRRRSVTIHASDTATRAARPATIHTTRAPVNHGAASITLMPDGPATNRRRPLGTVRLATRVACTAATPATSTTLPRSSRGPGPPGCSSSADSAVGAGLDQQHVLVGAHDVLAEHAADADQLAVELVLQQILARQQVRLGQRGAADALHHGVLERRRVVARLREADDFDDVAGGERHRLARVHLEAAGFVAQEDLVAAGDQHGALDPHQMARPSGRGEPEHVRRGADRQRVDVLVAGAIDADQRRGRHEQLHADDLAPRVEARPDDRRHVDLGVDAEPLGDRLVAERRDVGGEAVVVVRQADDQVLLIVAGDVADDAVELDQLAVLEPGEETPERGRAGAGQVGVADHRQAAGDDHRRELARAALALDLDDVAGAARRQVVFELAGEDVDAGGRILDHQDVPGEIDQRDAGAHLDLVSERRVARIEPAHLVHRGQHAPGAAGDARPVRGPRGRRSTRARGGPAARRSG